MWRTWAFPACNDSKNVRGIVYDSIRAGTSLSALVLDVVFER